MFGLNPYSLALKIGIVLIAFASGAGAAVHYEHLKQQAALAKAETEAIAITKSEDQVTLAAAIKAAKQQQDIAHATLATEIYVPVYVTRKAVARCIVPRGFVSLYNYRASHTDSVPTAAGQSVDAASGVGLNTVAGVESANLGKYHTIAAELKELQEWARHINAISNSSLKK